MPLLAPCLLAALVVGQTLGDGRALVVDVRLAGVAAAAVALALRTAARRARCGGRRRRCRAERWARGRDGRGCRRGHPQWCDAAWGPIMSSMNPTPSPTSPASQLTRSSSDKKIAGVAGGVAAYFGIDPVLARIGFAVTALCGGAGLLAYVAMMAFVPSDDAPPAAHPATA
jgi:phage shock protein C